MRFRNIDLRCVEIDGEPWFVAKDVCLALAVYLTPQGVPNVSMATAKLDAAERQLNRIELKAGYPRNVMTVSESGLYKLIMRSDKPEAKDFQHWVTAVVLSAIRKDGMYVIDEKKVLSAELDRLALTNKRSRPSVECVPLQRTINIPGGTRWKVVTSTGSLVRRHQVPLRSEA